MSPVAPSWQEHRLRAVELGEELSPVALCAHDKRCPFQLLQRRIAYRNLSQADAMLSGGVFQLRQTKLHLDHSRAKCLAKLDCLFGQLPVAEVGLWAGGISHNHIVDPVLQSIRPREYALHTGRIGRQDPNCREQYARRCHVLVHRIEPVGSHLSCSSTHVSEDDWRTPFDLVYEHIKSRGSVYLDLLGGA